MKKSMKIVGYLSLTILITSQISPAFGMKGMWRFGNMIELNLHKKAEIDRTIKKESGDLTDQEVKDLQDAKIDLDSKLKQDIRKKLDEDASTSTEKNVSTKFCWTKCYAQSLIQLFSKGLSEEVRTKLSALAQATSQEEAANNHPETANALDIFGDLISKNLDISSLTSTDEFYRGLDSALTERPDWTADKEPFFSNNTMQDPSEFLVKMLSFFDASKMTSLSTITATKRNLTPAEIAKKKDKSTPNYETYHEDSAAFHVINVVEGKMFSENFDSLFSHDTKITENDTKVYLHADTSDDGISYLIFQFTIFENIKDKKSGKAILRKISKDRTNNVNNSKEISVKIYPNSAINQNKTGKNKGVDYLLTPVATVSHTGNQLNSGHYVSKIRKVKKDSSVSWELYDGVSHTPSEIGNERTDIRKDADDYIIIYKAKKVTNKKKS